MLIQIENITTILNTNTTVNPKPMFLLSLKITTHTPFLFKLKL